MNYICGGKKTKPGGQKSWRTKRKTPVWSWKPWRAALKWMNQRKEKQKAKLKQQSFGLCGRGRGWDDLGEWHWNMYNIIYETSRQSRFDARYWMLGAGALGRPRGMVWGGRREEGSGWGTHVHLWQIHFDIWQNQYNIVKLNKIKTKNKKNKTKQTNKNKTCLVGEPWSKSGKEKNLPWVISHPKHTSTQVRPEFTLWGGP